MKKATIQFTIESQELKDAINDYANRHGSGNASTLSREALFEYLRRRKPESLSDVLHTFLMGKQDKEVKIHD